MYIHNVHECIGFALAVIRVTHLTQRKKYATHLYEHNTVVGQFDTVNPCVIILYNLYETVARFQLSFKQIQKQQTKRKQQQNFPACC